MRICLKSLGDSGSDRKEQRRLEQKAISSTLLELLGENINLKHSASGKPYLDGHPELSLSISHCRGYLALGIDTVPIGLDVERIDERTTHVAKRLLPSSLYRLIRQTNQEEQILLYLLAWTSSEALYKLVEESQGITDFVYIPRSLKHNYYSQTFTLLAYYRNKPKQKLYVQACYTDMFMLTVARYLPMDEELSFLSLVC